MMNHLDENLPLYLQEKVKRVGGAVNTTPHDWFHQHASIPSAHLSNTDSLCEYSDHISVTG